MGLAFAATSWIIVNFFRRNPESGSRGWVVGRGSVVGGSWVVGRGSWVVGGSFVGHSVQFGELYGIPSVVSVTRLFPANGESTDSDDAYVSVCIPDWSPWLLEACAAFPIDKTAKVTVPITVGSVESIIERPCKK
jgi:hypothetical protein